MPLPARRLLPLVSVITLLVVVPLAIASLFPPGILTILIRITGIAGALCLTLAAFSSAFVKELYRATHRPFKQVHHLLAISGTTLITLHPLLLAWQMKSLKILIPVINSWPDFLSWGGRIGIFFIFLGIFAAVIMKKIPSWWRKGHWLIYAGLLLGGVHALRMGQDMMSPTAKILSWVLLALTVMVFVYKQLRKPSPTKNIGATQTRG